MLIELTFRNYMKTKTIDNVIYPDFPQWKPKQKEEDAWEELVAFFGEDTARRQQNTIRHRRYEEHREEGRMEEAMIEWNKKK